MPLQNACIQIKEDNAPAYIIGDAQCLQNPETAKLMQENKDKPGIVCASQNTEGATATCAMSKQEMYTMSGEKKPIHDVTVKNLFMQLAETGMQKLQEHSAGLVAKTKTFAQKAAVFAMIIGSGVLASQIVEVKMTQPVEQTQVESQVNGPTKEQVMQAMTAATKIWMEDKGSTEVQKEPSAQQKQLPAEELWEKEAIVERIRTDNIPPLITGGQYSTPENEAAHVLFMRMTKDNATSVFLDDELFVKNRLEKYRSGDIEGWKQDGKDFREFYQFLNKTDSVIDNTMRKMSVEEMQKMDNSHPFVQMIRETETLKGLARMEHGCVSFPAILDILSQDGKNLSLSAKEAANLAYRYPAKMNTEEERRAYFTTHPSSPSERELTMLSVDMLQKMYKLKTPEEQQQLFTSYKKAEEIMRFRQTLEFAIEDKTPEMVWHGTALFSKDIDEAKKVFASAEYAGLNKAGTVQPEFLLEAVVGKGKGLLGSRGLDGLSAQEMMSVITSLDMTELRAMTARGEKSQMGLQQLEFAREMKALSKEEAARIDAAGLAFLPEGNVNSTPAAKGGLAFLPEGNVNSTPAAKDGLAFINGIKDGLASINGVNANSSTPEKRKAQRM